KLSGKVSAGNFTVLKRGVDYKGALKNSADGLRLFDNECNLLDEVLAAPNWPAGNNAEKRSAERAADFSWHNGNLSSPGAENSAPPAPFIASSSGGSVSVAPSNPVSDSSVSSTPVPDPTPVIKPILISEILYDAEGSDGEKEFIELYNPNNNPVDISSWSIQHKSASSSSTSKKNFEAGSIIAPKSFYLIWLGNDPRGDLKWLSGSLNNTAATISIVSDSQIIDSVIYDKNALFAPAGQSLERKALENSQCVSAQQAGEFLGNGCDFDSPTDWETRAMPNPQNKANMSEPRDAPLAIQNFRVDFSSATMELILNWSDSLASSSVSSTPNYQIVGDSELRFVTSTFATSTRVTIGEVGREFKFSIQSFDAEGLASAIAETAITTKFINSLYFYKDASSSQNFIEIKTDSYPFVPDLFALGRRWKELVFYLNDNLENPLILQYENCYNQTGDHGSLILPDDQMRCTNDGGMYGEGFNYKYIEDNNFLLKLANSSSTFSPSDYITVVYKSTHSTAPWDGRIVYLQPVAADRQKYYFQEIPPVHQSPQLNGEITITFRPEDSMAVINWPKTTDLDTPDNLLVYEIKYNGEGEWQETYGNFDLRRVAAGDSFSFSVRAKDPFNNYSESLFKNWEYLSP
ncbi:MAG: lamin tail domain-containing protein, partial [Patescibacteria group bacterium]